MFYLKMTYKYGNAIQKYHSIYVVLDWKNWNSLTLSKHKIYPTYTITYFLNTISIVERVSQLSILSENYL